MKKLIMIALLCGSQISIAENLVTLDGTVYKNVTIVSADPERMLIVHDGGGCQVNYTDLAGALSAEQRNAVEEGLKVYAERKVRMERLRQEAETKRQEQEAFAQAQRDKGLILFEGDWMKPVDRQEVLAAWELDRIERERVLVELEKQKADLRTAQRRTYTYYYSYPSVHASGCRCSRCYSGTSHHHNGHSYRYPKNSFGVFFRRGLFNLL